MSRTKVLHLVRHGQGYHQIPPERPNEHLRDPELTPYGFEQCKRFAEAFPDDVSIDLLCSSPMKRAIQTALTAFPRRAPVLCVPDAQEATDVPSDTGSSPADLKTKFGDNVDLSLVPEAWFAKEGDNAATIPALWARAKRLRRWVQSRPEDSIVLVTHGHFAHYVTGNIDEHGRQTGEYWVNVRWRSFTMGDDEDATLTETEGSKHRVALGGAQEHH